VKHFKVKFDDPSSSQRFLPRDAMLAQYMLPSRVCLSVRPSQFGELRRRLNKAVR